MHSSVRLGFVATISSALALGPAGLTGEAQITAGTIHTERLGALEFPWGMAYLPDGRLLVTEKPGRLRIFDAGQLSTPVEGVPSVAYRADPKQQGGLLDVAVDPDFAQNQHIYLSYAEEAAEKAATPDPGDPRFGPNSENGDDRLMGGAVMRARLDGNRLTDGQVIWRQEPKTVSRGHFGHRLVFGRDGTLFITSGDRMRFDPAQSLDANIGKVVRINRDGSVPRDNPFADKANTRGDVWSLGHRNMLAAAVHPGTGQLWVVEMGPLGGDELNVVERGGNYGWPAVSDGDNYDKSPIPDHRTQPQFKAAMKTWTPVISPSGALFYDGSLFSWRGSLIIGGLSSKGLIRLALDGSRVMSEQRIDLGRRIRDVIQAPDGAVLVLVDDQKGELLRVTPGQAQ